MVHFIADKYPDLKFKVLPTSYEVLPRFDWDKGAALGFIAEQIDLRDSAKGGHRSSNSASSTIQRSVFFAGDSSSDVPAFEWTNDNGGISVRVGLNDPLGAQYRLNEPADLLQLLEYVRNNIRAKVSEKLAARVR